MMLVNFSRTHACSGSKPQIKCKSNNHDFKAGAKQPVHWFLGGKSLGIQQGTSVWVGSPKSRFQAVPGKFLHILNQDPSDSKSN